MSTREHLILTAERLWGDRGLEAVSLRQISAAAGQANTAAVHYHFGNRAGLIEAIFEYRLPAFDDRRRELFAAVKVGGTVGTAALLDCLFRPFVEQTDDSGRHSYAAFQRQVLRSPTAQASRVRLLEATPDTIEILDRLAESLPAMHPALARRRLVGVIAVIMELICDVDTEIACKVAQRVPMETLYEDAIAIMGSAMSQPPPTSLAPAAEGAVPSAAWFRNA